VTGGKLAFLQILLRAKHGDVSLDRKETPPPPPPTQAPLPPMTCFMTEPCG
jgi:hypothetical protein